MGLGGNEPVREREFDRYAQDVDRRLAALEQWRKDHEEDHDGDDDDDRKDRQWSLGQVVQWAVVAATLLAAFLASKGGR